MSNLINIDNGNKVSNELLDAEERHYCNKHPLIRHDEKGNWYHVNRFAEREFVTELETISSGIASWAKQQFAAECSLAEVKRKLGQVMDVCNRN